MVGRIIDKKDKIRAYIQARSKLGCSLKQLMTEISNAYGPCVSYDTVRRWKKKFESGVDSIQNAPKSGRPKSASRIEIVSKIKEIIEGDARFTVRDIARKVGILLSTVLLILKKHLKVRKISARWVPHLLTDEQKKQRVKVAKKLLQMFLKYDKKQFANVVTGPLFIKPESIILSPSDRLAVRSGPIYFYAMERLVHRRRLSLQLGCKGAHLSPILYIKRRNLFTSCLIPLETNSFEKRSGICF